MRGYLLDTNIISYWFRHDGPENRNVVDLIGGLDASTPLRVSAITLGEIEYGHRVVSTTNTPIHVQFNHFVQTQLPDVLDVRRTTRIYYGQIRSRLFMKYSPRHGRKALRPEQLVDPATSATLGVQENDIWIAAQAVEHNLVLVTHDRMSHLRNVTGDILDFEDWVA